MVQACIFDLDGTLANTLSSIAYFGNLALKKFGFPPIAEERYRYLAGSGAKKLVRGMLAEHGCQEEEIFQKVYPYYVEAYDSDPLYLTAPYSGVPELLRALKAQGIRLGVLSNKPQTAVKGVVNSLFGADCFDLCNGARDGAPLKPDPAVLLSMLTEWDASPERCLYIGDTSVDMQTAHNAGIPSVGVLWGFRDRAELKAHRADYIIASPDEILPLAAK